MQKLNGRRNNRRDQEILAEMQRGKKGEKKRDEGGWLADAADQDFIGGN